MKAKSFWCWNWKLKSNAKLLLNCNRSNNTHSTPVMFYFQLWLLVVIICYLFDNNPKHLPIVSNIFRYLPITSNICQLYHIFANSKKGHIKFDQIPSRRALRKATLLAGSPPSETIEYFDSEFPPLELSDGILKIFIRNSICFRMLQDLCTGVILEQPFPRFIFFLIGMEVMMVW